ncbi:MAG: phosphoribosylglycinamide formyltransferase, partial [Bacteroidota bacterium]
MGIPSTNAHFSLTCSIQSHSSYQLQQIAIFASGTGSNARKIIEYFADHPSIKVSLVVSNRKSAPVLEMAAENGVATLVISRNSFYETEDILKALATIEMVVLAGFLWLIPSYLVKAFPQRIVNIHPALLPKYGGKGMYGMNVHRAVSEAGDSESGMTIHYVNEEYDEGQIIFQASCPLISGEAAENIAQKVLSLEHQYFAPVIEQL